MSAAAQTKGSDNMAKFNVILEVNEGVMKDCMGAGSDDDFSAEGGLKDILESDLAKETGIKLISVEEIK